jgi:hypothetical protein
VRTRVDPLGKGVGLLVREGLKTQPERRVGMPRLVADVPRKRWPRQLESRLIAGTQWKGPDYSDGQPKGFIFTGATGMVLQPRKADMYFAGVRTRAGLWMGQVFPRVEADVVHQGIAGEPDLVQRFAVRPQIDT